MEVHQEKIRTDYPFRLCQSDLSPKAEEFLKKGPLGRIWMKHPHFSMAGKNVAPFEGLTFHTLQIRFTAALKELKLNPIVLKTENKVIFNSTSTT